MSTEGLTLDRFLGGRVTAAQPASGFRAGHDTVLLAAAVPAESDSVVIELGAGAGIASLCLAARVPGARITGIELDPELVRLANENAVRNAVADRVSFVAADASIFPPPLLSAEARRAKADAGEVSAVASAKADGGGLFDHIFFNPPFHPDTGHKSPSVARDRATRDSHDAIREWTGRALSLVRGGGTVTAIVRADRVKDIQDAASPYGGLVFPLLPRAGSPPKRAIVRIIKMERGSLGWKEHQSPTALPSPLEGRGPISDSGAVAVPSGGAKRRKGGDASTRSIRGFVTLSGLILHEADGRNTEAAESVLRHAKPLDLAP